MSYLNYMLDKFGNMLNEAHYRYILGDLLYSIMDEETKRRLGN